MSKKDAQFNVRMSSQEREEIRRAAQELKIPESELMRRGALQYYKNRVAMQRANANRQRSEPDSQG